MSTHMTGFGSLHEHWHPGETPEYMRAAIDRVRRQTMTDNSRPIKPTLRGSIALTIFARTNASMDTSEGLSHAILSLIRERLLSDEAMKAATISVGRMDRTGGPDPNGYVRYKAHDYAEGAITAALDAIDELYDETPVVGGMDEHNVDELAEVMYLAYAKTIGEDGVWERTPDDDEFLTIDLVNDYPTLAEQERVRARAAIDYFNNLFVKEDVK